MNNQERLAKRRARYAIPENRARHLAYTKRPDVRARINQRARELMREKRKDPAYVEKMRSWVRKRAGIPEALRPEPPACELCGGPPTHGAKGLDSDHDHVTGKWRGW